MNTSHAQGAGPSHRPWFHDIRTHLSTHPPSSMWSSAKERSLLEPYTYLASRPGKEIRAKLIEAFNFWLEVPEDRLAKVRKVVEMLHNASLLMDDVEDNSDLRRGMPVAHKVYGTPQVLNTANYVYFLVFREIEAMGSGGSEEPTAGIAGAAPSASAAASCTSAKATLSERLLVEEMINLHRGQGLDLLWRDSLQCPTEEEYVEMVRNKTGGLLRIAGGLMAIWSPSYTSVAPEPGPATQTRPPLPDLLPLLDLIGLLFQIRDDYMNLDSDAYAQNKGFAEDLTEGKFSFPMIHGIRWSESSMAGATEQMAARSQRSHLQDGVVQPLASIPRVALDSPLPIRPVPDLTAIHNTSSADTRPPPSASIPAVGAAGIAPNRQLLSILSSRPTDEHIKRYAISYLRDVSGSFRYCRRVMRRLDAAIWQELEEVEKAFAHQQQGDGHKNELLRVILLALRTGWYEHDDGEDDARAEDDDFAPSPAPPASTA